jgi:GTP-binding protein
MSKNFPFQHVKFLRSALEEKDYPPLSFPEIAIIGRSNVGKSSLINHLLQQKVARTSSTPGKTQLLNFFLIDEALHLVDLPGYGFAKVSKETRKEWGTAIDHYLMHRSLSLCMLLLDARHLPKESDRMFIEWAVTKNIPLLLVFTKSDKLQSQELKAKIPEMFAEITPLIPKDFSCLWTTYSIKDQNSRKLLIQNIHQLLKNGPA